MLTLLRQHKSKVCWRTPGGTNTHRVDVVANPALDDLGAFTLILGVSIFNFNGNGRRFWCKGAFKQLFVQTAASRLIRFSVDRATTDTDVRLVIDAEDVAGGITAQPLFLFLVCVYDEAAGIAELWYGRQGAAMPLEARTYDTQTIGTGGTVADAASAWKFINSTTNNQMVGADYNMFALFNRALTRLEANVWLSRQDDHHRNLLFRFIPDTAHGDGRSDEGGLGITSVARARGGFVWANTNWQTQGYSFPGTGDVRWGKRFNPLALPFLSLPLLVQDAAVGVSAEAPALLPKTPLTVADAVVAIAADNVTVEVSGAVTLDPAEATVGIAAESPALVQKNLLAVADALVSIAADAPALVQKSLLAAADATVGIAAESPTLSTAVLLTVADAAVAIAADAPALLQKNLLAVADALVALAAESPALVQKNLLTVPDATVGVTAENITLSLAALLIVADAAIAVTNDGIVLATDVPLAIQNALVGIAAESPAVIQASVLTVPDALVAVLAGGLVLVIPSEAAVGKYAPEHAAALEAIRGAQGFASEHAGALSDLRQAGA